ncbi:MAG: hypothetical protein N2Z65_01065 [Clostridiales bacterium]|nr:hypothetical protein [Clostridiales bacterium]
MWEKIRQYKYSIIFILSIVISALICLVMLFQYQASKRNNVSKQNSITDHGKEYKYEPKKDGTIILKETDVEKMITKELPEGFPLQNIKITLEKTNKATLTGEVEQDKLKAYISKSGDKLNSYIEMGLKLCPKTINVSAVFDVGIAADGGLIILTTRKIEAAGVTLPDGTLPQDFFDGLNESVNRALTNSGYLFQSISIKDGYVELIP